MRTFSCVEFPGGDNGLWRGLPQLLRVAAAARRATFSGSPNAKVICKVFFVLTLTAGERVALGDHWPLGSFAQLRKGSAPFFAEKRPEL